MISLAGVLVLVVSQIGSDPNLSAERHDPFQVASITPSSVRLFLHIHDAARLRAEVEDRPFAQWISVVIAKKGSKAQNDRSVSMLSRDGSSST